MSAPEGFTEIRLIDPFEIHVGPAYGEGDKGARRYAFRVAVHHGNLRGVVHGGMLMTFADLALGQAAWDATDNAAVVTLNMQVQFMAPAREGDLVEVRPEITRRTGGMVFVRGDFTVGSEIVMTAQSVWKLLGKD
jgi:uncharacterized protein (TIGR00369 family)